MRSTIPKALKRQLEQLDRAALEELRNWTQARLLALADEDASVRKPEAVTGEVRPASRSVRAQYVRCGRPDCSCATGKGHGPYWYEYWREGGRIRSKYLGKKRPA